MISVAKLVRGFSNSSKVGMVPNTPFATQKKNKTTIRSSTPKIIHRFLMAFDLPCFGFAFFFLSLF